MHRACPFFSSILYCHGELDTNCHSSIGFNSTALKAGTLCWNAVEWVIFKSDCEYQEIAEENLFAGACCHISCHSSPLLLTKGRCAESLLHCPLPIAFSSILCFLINLLSFSSIATACGWEWGEGPSLGHKICFCYLCAGAAVVLFPFCSSPAAALAQDCSQLMQKVCMGSAVFRISTSIFTFLIPIWYALAPWTCLTRCVCTSEFSLHYLSPYSILSIIQIAMDNSFQGP